MKKLITNYSFDPANRQIRLNEYSDITLEGLLLITNVSNSSKPNLYQFNITGNTATVSGNVITLAYNTTSMNALDDLQIFYDDGVSMTDLLTILTDKLENDDRLLRQIVQLLKPLGITVTANGRAIVDVGSISSLPTLATVTTVNTVTNLTNLPALPNQVNIGGLNALDQQFNIAHLAFAESLRMNVTF